MKIKVIIFDLDDTLYNEIDYVKSGFQEVSKYFSTRYTINFNEYYNYMLLMLEKYGRGMVFDLVLKKYGLYSKSNVSKSISIYRTHSPNIELPKLSLKLLQFYNTKNIPLYIITDGNKLVQKNKIFALHLKKYCQKILITHNYGRKYSKPSTYCFNKIANLEKVSYNEIVYIGDNISKDFVNIKKLGFRTIRIKQGMFKNETRDKEFHAEIDIESLVELKNIIKV